MGSLAAWGLWALYLLWITGGWVLAGATARLTVRSISHRR